MKYLTIVGTGLLVASLTTPAGRCQAKPGDKDKAALPYGTVTKTKRIPGDQVAKGDCRKLVQGGYMKFDLSKYPTNYKFSRAQLKVFVKEHSGNGLRWVSLLKTDPTVGKIEDVFNEIQKHKALLTGYLSLKRGLKNQWVTFNLDKRGAKAIKERLAKQSPEERWIAMTLAFE